MFEITDSDGEIRIEYNGEGRQWILAMMQEEESQLLGLLLARAGGLQNLTLAEVEEPVPREVWMPKNPDRDECEGPDECDAPAAPVSRPPVCGCGDCDYCDAVRIAKSNR